ncbi:hypothetical protein BDQ17DRAFT_1334880 [Cyathus striatus]|nr:hypothetical protein BDQ17DRAFT_1334880 [Cyathus striatus]
MYSIIKCLAFALAVAQAARAAPAAYPNTEENIAARDLANKVYGREHHAGGRQPTTSPEPSTIYEIKARATADSYHQYQRDEPVYPRAMISVAPDAVHRRGQPVNPPNPNPNPNPPPTTTSTM